MAKVFISYSHRDENWKDRVVKHLRVLVSEGLEVWDDRKIVAGDAWADQIGTAIASCDVVLLLVSADFLASQFILGHEVPALLKQRQEQGIRVIPLILSHCVWRLVPWLSDIQVCPKDGEPLSGMSRHAAEAALADLAGKIADLLLKPISKSSSLPTPRPPGVAPSPAAAIWREKLEFLRVQEAICSDPAQRFTLKKQIEEAEAKLRGLS